MESDCVEAIRNHSVCNGNEASAAAATIDFKEEDLETRLLLSSAVVNGEAAAAGGKRRKDSVRKVRFNDCRLTEVLEFQPSDWSDSEDEYADSCNCTVM